MATNAKTTRSCWVNAGPKAIAFSPIDGKGWNHPVFVNGSNELRISILNALHADKESAKGYTLLIEIDKAELVRHKTEAGEIVFRFDASDAEAFLDRVLPTRRVKGSLNEDRKGACEKALAKHGVAVNWDLVPTPRESNQTNSTDIFG